MNIYIYKEGAVVHSNCLSATARFGLAGQLFTLNLPYPRDFPETRDSCFISSEHLPLGKSHHHREI